MSGLPFPLPPLPPKPWGSKGPKGGGKPGGGGAGPGAGRAPGYGELRIDAPDFTIYVRQGPDTPIKAVDPGWELVERRRDTSVTVWRGGDPNRETVSVMLDNFRRELGVERMIERIESLRRVPNDEDHPPVFRVSGGIRLSGVPVVLEALEYGDVQERRAPDDRIIRQQLTLGLLRYVRPDQVRIKRKKNGVYVTKGRQSLLDVAKKVKPNQPHKKQADYAREIGKRHKPAIRDIRRKLSPGTKLRLP